MGLYLLLLVLNYCAQVRILLLELRNLLFETRYLFRLIVHITIA